MKNDETMPELKPCPFVIIGYEDRDAISTAWIDEWEEVPDAVRKIIFGSVDDAKGHDDMIGWIVSDLKEKGFYEFEIGEIYIANHPRAERPDPELAEVREALVAAEEYFDNLSDADCDQDGYIPNEEMRLLVGVREAVAILDRKIGGA